MENHYKMNIVSLEMDLVAEASAESTLSNSIESGVTAECSRADADSKLEECAGWTNEKHNSYLDYLENSFVSQLYSFLGGDTRRLSRTREVQSNSYKSTDQFKVLQNGCWQKETSSESYFLKKSMRSSPENPNGTCTMGTTAEASGQNFREEEKRCDPEMTRKRKRESNNDDSSLKDQVVPVRMVQPKT